MRFDVAEQTAHAREVVFAAHRDRLPEIARYLDAVERVEAVQEGRGADGSVVLTHLWFGTPAALPVFLRPLVPPQVLRWRQQTTWDGAGWVAEWVIDVPALGAAVDARGVNRYLAAGRGCRIEVEGDLAFRPERVPQLAQIPASAVPMVEKAVISMIVPLVQRSGQAVARWLDEHHRR